MAIGFWQRRVVPRIVEKGAAGPEADRFRKQSLAPARGRVLEVGFGTGLNLPHYPKGVSEIVAIEPNPGMEKYARRRIQAQALPVAYQVGVADKLPFPDKSFDTVVTTLTLCSIDEVEKALAELRRVLVPDGRYLLWEHGLSEDVKVQRWQHRMNGFNMMMLGGCRLNRPIARLVADAGFRIQTKGEAYWEGQPKFAGWMTIASATPA